MTHTPTAFPGYEHLTWTEFNHVPESLMSAQERAWVLGEGSLTRELIRASEGNFRVEVIAQEFCIPCGHERLCLGLSDRDLALVREVKLWVKGAVWVMARSVIPQATLTGEEQRLATLGDLPLGDYIFKQKTMNRQPIQLAFEGDKLRHSNGIGRRSIFTLHDKPILVSEFFQPICLESNLS